MKHIAQSLFLAALAFALAATPPSGVASASSILLTAATAVDGPHIDADGDGVLDQIDVTTGFAPQSPIVAQLAAVSGIDNSTIWTHTAAQANDLLGDTVLVVADQGGDGIEELVVSAPRYNAAMAQVGRVYVLSGADGSVGMEFSGPAGLAIGMDIAAVVDQDLGGYDDVLVEAGELSASGELSVYTLLFSSETGELLASFRAPLDAVLARVTLGYPLYLPGDTDRDGDVDYADLYVFTDAYVNGDLGVADLNWDGVLTTSDFVEITTNYGDSSAFADAAPQESVSTLAAWNEVYPDSPATEYDEDTGPESTCGSCPQGGSGGCWINLTGCPFGTVSIDQLVTLTAEVSPTGGDYCWEVVDGADRVEILSPTNGPQFALRTINSGQVIVRVKYTAPDGCEVCEECVFDISACSVTLSGCVDNPHSRMWTFVAEGVPPGGSYDWEITSGGSLVQTYEVSSDGDTMYLVGNGNFGSIEITVTYIIGGCVASASCSVLVGPTLIDSDGDGLDDNVDPCPNDTDCDGDGYSDYCEYVLGSDMENANSIPDLGRDQDLDGLTDVEELCGGLYTNPFLFDTDGDGAQDLAEVELAALGFDFDPRVRNSDGSGPWDGEEPEYLAHDLDRDGLYDEYEREMGWDPTDADQNGNGTDDGDDTDSGDPPDGDGWGSDIGDLIDAFCPDGSADSDNDGLCDDLEVLLGTDPNYFDSDNDGLPDLWELENGLNPLSSDSDNDGIPDGDEDNDGDGLSNWEEYLYGTDPNNSDSDGDGTSDGDEVDQGSDPNDSSDNGEAPDPEDIFDMLLTVGDSSPSHSERWALKMSPPPPAWFRGPLGNVDSHEFTFARGEVIEVSLKHLGTRLSSPDYDYEAGLSTTDECVCVDDPDELLGVYGDVGTTFESKVVDVLSPKLVVTQDGEEIDLPLEVLPGDIRELEFTVTGVRPSDTVTCHIFGSQFAQFMEPDDSFTDTITLDGETPIETRLAGLNEGNAIFYVRVENALGIELLECQSTLYVGGTIEAAVSRYPRFVPTTNADYLQSPAVSQEFFDAAIAVPPKDSVFTVFVEGPTGAGMANVPVRLLYEEGFIKAEDGEELLEKTNAEGYAFFEIAADQIAISTEYGGLPSGLTHVRENVFILAGYRAEELDADDLSEIDGLRDTQFASVRAPTGNRVFERFNVVGDGTLESWPGFAMITLAVNHIQQLVIDVNVEGRQGILPEGFVDYTGEPLDLYTGDGADGEPVFGTDNSYEEDFPLDFTEPGREGYFDTVIAPGLTTDLTAIVNGSYTHPEGDSLGGLYDPVHGTDTVYGFTSSSDLPPGSPEDGLNPVEAGVVAGEFMLGFAPGYDVKDVFVYGFWKNVFGEPSTENYVVATVSLFGLMADAGYLAGPTGFVTNAVTSTGKCIAKFVDPALIKQIATLSDDGFTLVGRAKNSIVMYFNHMKRWPTETDFPGWSQLSAVLDWGKELTVGSINQFRRAMEAGNKLTDADVGSALTKLYSFLGDAPENAIKGTLDKVDVVNGVGVTSKFVSGGGNTTDLLFTKLSSSAGGSQASNESIGSVASAIGRTARRAPDSTGAPDAADLWRIEESITNATSGAWVPSSVRDEIAPFVGNGQPFKSMDEFEAIRVHPARSLTEAQTIALRTARDQIPNPPLNSPVQKVIALDDTMWNPQNIIEGGSPNIAGFLGRAEEFPGNDVPVSQLIDRYRLDYPGSGLSDTSPYVVLETRMSSDMTSKIKTPRTTEFAEGASNSKVINDPFPYVGNGYTASRDGVLTPEWVMDGPAVMPIGETNNLPNTVLRFRFSDGSDYPQTFNGLGPSAAWKLVDDLNSPTGFSWVPHP
ncbi:MAG: hypothetical protein HND58_12950 [Planctomycetota bacterium]|nr:MAG: hypothetical protein HND58_12950 [Planctomycetota bacterium]